MGWDTSELENRETTSSFGDLSYISQQAYLLYTVLPDRIDGMIGWTGKDFSSLEYIMDLLSIYRDRKKVFHLLLICIDEFGVYCKEQIKKTESVTGPPVSQRVS